jgi:hypothetical protein
MHQGKRIVLLAIFVWAAASAAHAQTTLRYQFKEGDKLHYVVEQKTKTTMNIMDKDMETKMNATLDVSWNIVKVDREGNAQVQLKVTRARVAVEAPVGKGEWDSDSKEEPVGKSAKAVALIAKSLAALELAGTFAPTGESKDMKVTEESLKALNLKPNEMEMKELVNSDLFKVLMFQTIFSKDGIAKGKSWSNKTETKSQIGKIASTTTATYEGPAEKDGVTLEKATLKTTVKLDADPDAAVKFTIKSAKGAGHVLFDNKSGRLIEAVTNNNTEVLIEAMEMKGTQTTEQTTTIRLQKK